MLTPVEGKMKILIISALALTFVSQVDAFNAQQKGEKTSNMQEMLKATQPSERHKQLESLAGNWDVLVRFKYGLVQNAREKRAVRRRSGFWEAGFFSRNIKPSLDK